MELKDRKRIAVLVVYYGVWPDWTNYFLSSCVHNKLCDFLIISNVDPRQCIVSNIFFFPLSFSELSRLISYKSGITIELNDPYKLCDFKPLYGVIFEEYLKDYLFWGYCDIDLIFGDLTDLLSENSMMEYDIIFGYEKYASGPFSLYRNVHKINYLFNKINGLADVLSNAEYQGLDENINKSHLKISCIAKIFFLVIFLSKLLISRKINYLKSYHELKFQFYWFLKEKTIKIPRDITEVVIKEMKSGRIKVKFGHYILSDAYFRRIRLGNWIVQYHNGKLTEKSIHDKITFFHFREIKNTKDFKIEIASQYAYNFCISSNGIRICHE